MPSSRCGRKGGTYCFVLCGCCIDRKKKTSKESPENDDSYQTIIYMHALYLFRYHEVFFMIDTCQAESMHQMFYSPNILAVASSKVGEDSLSVSKMLPFFSISVQICRQENIMSC